MNKMEMEYNVESKEVMDAIKKAFQIEDKIIIKELTEDVVDLYYVSKTSIVDALGFVWDECHKIYIVEDEDDIQDIQKTWSKDTTIYDLAELPRVWSKSCPLRFISNWKLTKHYVEQSNNAMFEFPLWEDK